MVYSSFSLPKELRGDLDIMMPVVAQFGESVVPYASESLLLDDEFLQKLRPYLHGGLFLLRVHLLSGREHVIRCAIL